MAKKAMDIAKYIINKCTVDNHPISNLQLQKILYYVQKKFLDNGRIAFDDEFEAWQFGPVVPEVYSRYCGFGSASIRVKYSISLERDYSIIINPIVNSKRCLNPWDLVNDTHESGKTIVVLCFG